MKSFFFAMIAIAIGAKWKDARIVEESDHRTIWREPKTDYTRTLIAASNHGFDRAGQSDNFRGRHRRDGKRPCSFVGMRSDGRLSLRYRSGNAVVEDGS